MKHELRSKSVKTVNNVLTVLNVMLKKAVEWDAIERMPCAIRLLPIPKGSAGFYDFDDYERLVAAAQATHRNAHLIVLLGAEAGLRCGEMMALEWIDVDLGKRQLCVQRSDWKGHVTVTKGGRLHYVPLTIRLVGALREHRHLRGARVLCQPDGSPLTQKNRARPRAAVSRPGAAREERRPSAETLVLFPSRDARGARPRDSGVSRELAGHEDLTTTQRYMHLSPAAIQGAIQLLDQRDGVSGRGNSVATPKATFFVPQRRGCAAGAC